MKLHKINEWCGVYEAKQLYVAASVKVLMTTTDLAERSILEHWLAKQRLWLLDNEDTYTKFKGFLHDQGSDS